MQVEFTSFEKGLMGEQLGSGGCEEELFLGCGEKKSEVCIFREDPLNYRVLGVACGTVALIASARSASGRDLHSLPHELQVFAPLQLLPKAVTLVPESVFQV